MGSRKEHVLTTILCAAMAMQVESWIMEHGTEWVGQSWDELKYIRQVRVHVQGALSASLHACMGSFSQQDSAVTGSYGCFTLIEKVLPPVHFDFLGQHRCRRHLAAMGKHECLGCKQTAESLFTSVLTRN